MKKDNGFLQRNCGIYHQTVYLETCFDIFGHAIVTSQWVNYTTCRYALLFSSSVLPSRWYYTSVPATELERISSSYPTDMVLLQNKSATSMYFHRSGLKDEERVNDHPIHMEQPNLESDAFSSLPTFPEAHFGLSRQRITRHISEK
jgi:hypothetical protein